jgi:hypothetical protein
MTDETSVCTLQSAVSNFSKAMDCLFLPKAAALTTEQWKLKEEEIRETLQGRECDGMVDLWKLRELAL